MTGAQAGAAAEKSAQANAMRSLELGLQGIKISEGKTVGDAMEQPEIKPKIQELLGNYRITSKRYFSDHGMEMDVEVPLPPIADVVLPPSPATAPTASGRKKNTGLIVDARGLDLMPALAPKLIDERKKEIYGIDSLTPEARRSAGVAAYGKGIAEALKSMRIGDKPLVVKALGATGSDLMLNSAAVRAIEESNPTYLRDGRVVIVLGAAGARKTR